MKTKISHAWHLCLASLTGFILAMLFFNQSLLSSNSNIYKILRSKTKELQQIISYVNHFYFGPVNMEEIMDGAFHGLMEELDPHSVYIPAKEPFRLVYTVTTQNKQDISSSKISIIFNSRISFICY